MIYLKSEYSTQPFLYLPRVAYGEIVSLEYPQAITRDMTAKNNIRQLKTVEFTIERVQPDNVNYLKKFLNETQGYPVQLDFIPHLIRFRGILTEVEFVTGRLQAPQTQTIDELTGGIVYVFGGNSGSTPILPPSLAEADVNIKMIAVEYIDLTEQMIINDLEEAGLSEDPSGTVGILG